ncbi:hypothetical protein ASD83_13965 [Devosia sp. Root685]|uniref:response regulator transcription factor n=1 Tax=Devosia sp. Root685 TaxID=1736587 RepID=UPI0006F916A4|nr:response regulator transcription factor [Devosia sp. Root685]KRA98151.1 hypothetical protein ASD83_13965 [Devosia sp. Root685]
MVPSILVVEDDDFKLDRIREAIRSALPNARVEVADSVQRAIGKLEGIYSLIVLDMALPSHTVKAGASPATSLPSGGIEVLLELAYLGRTDMVVVVTQYPEIEIDDTLYPTPTAIKAFHAAQMMNVTEVLKYEPEGSDWAVRLVNIVSSL